MNGPDRELSAEEKQILDLMNRAAEQISEYVESVRIFVTRRKEDGSGDVVCLTTGRGNFMAQIGQVNEWSVTQEEYAREKARIDQRKELEE